MKNLLEFSLDELLEQREYALEIKNYYMYHQVTNALIPYKDILLKKAIKKFLARPLECIIIPDFFVGYMIMFENKIMIWEWPTYGYYEQQ
jgi:hypothetical protein